MLHGCTRSAWQTSGGAPRRYPGWIHGGMFAAGLLAAIVLHGLQSVYSSFCPDLMPAFHRRDPPPSKTSLQANSKFSQHLLIAIYSVFSTSDINGPFFEHRHLRNRCLFDNSCIEARRFVHNKQQLGDIGGRHVSSYHDRQVIPILAATS